MQHGEAAETVRDRDVLGTAAPLLNVQRARVRGDGLVGLVELPVQRSQIVEDPRHAEIVVSVRARADRQRLVVGVPGAGELPLLLQRAAERARGFGGLIGFDAGRGSAIPIKLQVENAAGTNVSSAGLAVEALVVSSGTEIGPAEEEVLDAGQANPPGRFRFVAEGAYLFNLKTTNLKAGPYVLVVRVAGDPTLHAVPFLIREP